MQKTKLFFVRSSMRGETNALRTGAGSEEL